MTKTKIVMKLYHWTISINLGTAHRNGCDWKTFKTFIPSHGVGRSVEVSIVYFDTFNSSIEVFIITLFHTLFVSIKSNFFNLGLQSLPLGDNYSLYTVYISVEHLCRFKHQLIKNLKKIMTLTGPSYLRLNTFWGKQ